MDYLKKAKYFKTKKRLGQNFLVSEEVIGDIIKFANLSDDDTVLEIGAGAGFVTEQLIKHAKHVIALELDEDAIAELQKIKADNLEIVHADILKTDISKFKTDKKIKIVANIPYYITTPILAHLLGEIDDLNNQNRQSINEIILMVQEEVARRMTANENSPQKQYGLLSILSQFWSDCSILRIVGARCFYPKPKVTSALVKLVVKDKPLLELTNYQHFRKTIKSAFGQRRKNLKNALINGGFNKDIVKSALEELNIDENTRGEKLSIEDFGKLSEVLLCKSK